MSADVPARVAAVGLHAGAPGLPAPGERWPASLALLGDQRLTGLAVRAVLDGAWDLTDGQAAELLELHQRAMCRTLDHERALLEVSEAFHARGIGSVVLKGPAFAHAFYPDPSLRPFTDLDLLVAAEDWTAAGAALRDLGYTRAQPEPRAGFDVRFGKAAEYVDDHGVTVDLHRTLVLGPFGLWIEPEELLATTVPFLVGSRTFHRLDDSASALHACLHASLGWWPPTLLSLRDLAQIVLHGDVTWERLLNWVDRWRLHAVAADAFEATERVLGVSPPPALRPLVAGAAPRREQRLLASYRGSARLRGGPALATLAAIPGIRSKLAYVRALVLPERDFLAARSGGGTGSYLQRWAVPLRWLTRRRR